MRVFWSCLFVLVMLGVPSTPVRAADHLLTIECRDAATAVPLAARVGVFHDDWEPCVPVDLEAHVYQSIDRDSYFYVDGSTSLLVPADTITVEVGRGFEYRAVDTTLVVAAPTTLTLDLHRIADMQALGYYSGDTHVHIAHPPNTYALGAGHLLLVARGEDLNVANSMEDESFFTGSVAPVSTAQRQIFFSKEQRNLHFGHLSVVGLRQWVPDYWCSEPGLCGAILNEELYDMAHATQGEVAVIATHPFTTFNFYNTTSWPGGGAWRGMPLDLAAGSVDAMDLLSFWTAPPPEGIEPYFQVLNAGLRLPPAAGTDCTLGNAHSRPAGSYRMYVSPDGPFTFDSWTEGLKAGRSFVTNYPLFTHFDVAGVAPGGEVVHVGWPITGSVAVTCALPIDTLQIIGDSGVLHVLTPPGGAATSFSTTFEINPRQLTWVVARVTGPSTGWHVVDANGLFAQTAPVYLRRFSGYVPRAKRVEAVEYFLDMLIEVENAFSVHGVFPGGSRAAFDAAVSSAREYFYSIHPDPTPTSVGGAPTAGWAFTSAWPNPFNPSVRIGYTVPSGGGQHDVVIYDVVGRRVRALFRGKRPGGEYRVAWDGRDDGGGPAPSGVYYVRLTPQRGRSSVWKIVLVR